MLEELSPPLDQFPPPAPEQLPEPVLESFPLAEEVLPPQPIVELPSPLLVPNRDARDVVTSASCGGKRTAVGRRKPRVARCAERADDHRQERPTNSARAPMPVELEPYIDEAITLRRSLGAEFFSWLHNRFPGQAALVPAGAIEPSWGERRAAWQLAVVVAASAVLSLLPVIVLYRGHLPSAPHWALLAVLLVRAVQLVFAGWMVNAPDWATARVQMMVSAAATTIYAMVMTLLLITPDRKQLPQVLEEVRKLALAPAWCGLICVVMAAVTWHCGYTAARWRREAEEDGRQ